MVFMAINFSCRLFNSLFMNSAIFLAFWNQLLAVSFDCQFKKTCIMKSWIVYCEIILITRISIPQLAITTLYLFAYLFNLYLFHSMNRSQLINNFLAQSYHALRESDRFIQERGTKSYFESFWDMLNSAFSLGLKGYHPPNSTVESFYRGTLDVREFCIQARETIVDKNLDKIDANIDPLLTISWEIYSSLPSRKRICESIPKLCRRQLWGIFNKFDSDNSGFAMIDDVIEVIIKIYKANGQEESEENIREWFCDQQRIDFWSFFSSLVEPHSRLLTAPVLQAVYDVNSLKY